MPETPCDRSLALAAQVSTMRDHFLEVSCGCGESRVISPAVMAKERRIATATLAHIALRITCHGCKTGPDEVHLCATSRGRQAAKFGGRGSVDDAVGHAWQVAILPPATSQVGM